MINRMGYILFFLIGISFCSNFQISQSKIILSNIYEEELDLGFSMADYNFTSPFEIRVDSKNEWDLYIQSKDLNLVSNNTKIPIQKIQWKKSTDLETAYKPLSYDKIWIASSQQNNNGIIELNFRIMLNWMTPPGEFSVPVEVIFEDRPGISKKRKLIKAMKSR